MTGGARQYLYERPVPGRQINRSHLLSYKLAGCWLLNEGGYSAYDLVKNNNGTALNFGSPPTRTTLGIKLNPTLQQNLSLNRQVVYPNINIAYTVSGWYKSTMTSSGDLFGEGDTASTSSILAIGINDLAAGDITFNVRDTNLTVGKVTYDCNSNDNDWHNIVGIQRNKSLREVYFDGRLVNSDTTTLANLNSNNSRIGSIRRTSTINYFNGTIGNILIYHRALSSNEVKNLYINPYSMII